MNECNRLHWINDVAYDAFVRFYNPDDRELDDRTYALLIAYWWLEHNQIWGWYDVPATAHLTQLGRFVEAIENLIREYPTGGTE